MLSNRKKSWRFNQSPLFLEYLMGKRDYKCTPWGMPTYNVFGWQKPCYLLQDGYAESYKELMETTEWTAYGTESGNPQCANCMVHCGYEPSSVDDTFGSLRGFADTVKATFSLYPDKDRFGGSRSEVRPVHSYNPLVQIRRPSDRPQTEESAAQAGRKKPTMSGRQQGPPATPLGRVLSRKRRGTRNSPPGPMNSKSSPVSSAKICRAGFPQLATEANVRAVIEKAFDYRGDVTITRKHADSNKNEAASPITGYLFDRRIGPTLETSVVRLMLATSSERPAIPYSEIAAIAFTGRDTAAGKSYEAWVKKYWEKRAQGEKNISIEPEALE